MTPVPGWDAALTGGSGQAQQGPAACAAVSRVHALRAAAWQPFLPALCVV